ncbi:MAG: polyphosphate polymerase domain-containing protein [Clostridia bacterium]|nr:polyphosphate polymerase domain-containing protein [Clostridia bacterium]
MCDQRIFKRYELKFFLTRRQRERLMQAMAGHLALDRFGRSRIRNIYFDTDTYRLARRSIEKPLYKEKLRVRAYGKPGPNDPVFVELKKKFDSVVYKRRIALPHRAAMDALERRQGLPTDEQIGREIDAFRSFYGPTLLPSMLLTYEREAFFPTDGVDFRLTLDENILWRTQDVDLGGEIWGQPLLEDGQTLMELKTPGGLPMWMVRFLSENRIYQTSYSKYGTAYQHMLTGYRDEGGLLHAG